MDAKKALLPTVLFIGLLTFLTIKWLPIESEPVGRGGENPGESPTSSVAVEAPEVKPRARALESGEESTLRARIELRGILQDGREVEGPIVTVSSKGALRSLRPENGKTYLHELGLEDALLIAEWSSEEGVQFQGSLAEVRPERFDRGVIVIPLSPVSATISFLVLRDGIPQVSYPLFVQDGEFNETLRTNADGWARYDAPRSGEYGFKFGSPLNPERVIRRELVVGESSSTIVSLFAGMIRLEVLSPDGSAANEGTPVSLWPGIGTERIRVGSTRLGETSNLGIVEFAGVEAGEYMLVVGDEPWSRGVQSDPNASPLYVHLNYEGGDENVTVNLPYLTTLFVETGIEVSGEFRPTPVPVWIEEVGGESVSRWGFSGTGSHPTGRETVVPPGDLLVRACRSDLGFGEVRVNTVEGQSNRVRLVLTEPPFVTSIEIDMQALSEFRRIWIYDESGVQLGFVSLAQSRNEERIGFTFGAATQPTSGASDVEGSVRRDPQFCFPGPGTYHFVATRARESLYLGPRTV